MIVLDMIFKLIKSHLDVMHAINPLRKPSPAAVRLASLGCITFAFLLHGTNVRWGIRVQNVLGVFKLFVLIGIALSGLATLLRVPGFVLEDVSAVVILSVWNND